MQVGGALGGRFELRGLLGAGACGAVFAAYDRERAATVAIKRPHAQDGPARARLRAEYEALARLRHPGVVATHGLFVARSTWFFSMELVEGAPLPAATLAIRDAFAQLCAAVTAIHAAGLVHRDLKPANVRVTPAGRVVVLDLGLAARAGEGAGEFVGAPSAMAPEQWSGGPALEASDWYSVGLLLYERLTGARAFVGEVMAVMRDKLAGRFVPPRELVPAVPPELDAACCALLDPRPEARAEGAARLRRAVGAGVAAAAQ